MIYEGITISQEDDSFEQLRGILEQLRGGTVSYAEARDFGDSLIDFYELLAGGAQDEHS
jgi:hypothetical protein